MSGFVYLIRSNSGLYKVGYSTQPQRRLISLQTGSPYQLSMIGYVPATIQQERELHALLAPWRVAGEWFQECAGIHLFASLFTTPVTAVHPIIAYAKANRRSMQSIADRASCSRMTLHRVVQGKQNATLDLLARISQATDGAVRVADLIATGAAA